MRAARPAACRAGEKRDNGAMEPDEDADGVERSLPVGCILPFLLVLWLLGLALTVDWLRLVVRSVQVASWREIPARVEEAGVDDFSDGEGRSERLRVAFRYEVDGRTYHGALATPRQRAWLFPTEGLLRASQDHLRTARAALRAGTPLPCRVNPHDPSEAYLFSMSAAEWIEPTLLAIVLGVLPLAALVAWLRSRRGGALSGAGRR
jgi:hypothetical protein